jgi:hypothetical protein
MRSSTGHPGIHNVVTVRNLASCLLLCYVTTTKVIILYNGAAVAQAI